MAYHTASQGLAAGGVVGAGVMGVSQTIGVALAPLLSPSPLASLKGLGCGSVIGILAATVIIKIQITKLKP